MVGACVRFVVVTAGLLVGSTLASSGPASLALEPGSPARADQVVARLVRQHHCWTEAAPPGAGIPSRALVTLPGERTRLMPARVGFDIWLRGAKGHVHAFCR